MKIERVADVSDELVAAMARLLPQLSPRARRPTLDELRDVLKGSGTTLLVARDERDEIVGTLTLLVTATPSKLFGFVEDVVVDQAARGRSVGEALVREALRIAAEQGARETDLHTGDHRGPAIRLYERAGFVAVGTNVYRYTHIPRE